MWWSRTQRLLAAVLIVAGVSTPAAAIDCARGGCIDASRLPPGPGVDWRDLISRAQRFFSADAGVFIVSSAEVQASLPYILPRQVSISVNQIHIPEIYHAQIEARYAGAPHYIWHYIVGHEMAHAYQYRLGVVEALEGPFDSVVAAELHADYLAGFFLAREYGLSIAAIDQLLEELRSLPSGKPGDFSYHGEPEQRFFALMQGALYSLGRPAPSREDASVSGLELAFDLSPRPNAQ